MAKHLMVVLTNPVEGREDEYNDWYSNTHLADVLKIPGVTGATRFALSEAQRGTAPYPFHYMAIYEIETDDLAEVMADLGRRSGTSVMPLSSAMADVRSSLVFKPIPGATVGEPVFG